MPDEPTRDADTEIEARTTAGTDPAESDTVDPETLARLPEFYTPRVSPDGDELAFFHDTSGRMELYSLSLADDRRAGNGEWTQWSDGNIPRSLSGAVAWGHDGEQCYFHHDTDGDEQNDIHAISRVGETETIIETDGQAFLVGVAPDGEYLLYVADEGEQLNLYRYDRRTGTREQLTAHDRPVVGGYVTLDADGEAIAYATNEADNPENRDVYVVDPNGGEPRRLDIGETGAQATVGDWFPDGERLLVGDDTPDLDRVGVYDLREDTVSWLSDGTAVEEPVSVSPDGKRAVALRTREAATVPVVYDLAADESRELDLREGVSRPVGGRDGGFVGRSRLLCTHQTGTKRSEVVGYDLDADGVETVLAAEYGDVDPAAFVAPEYVTYESADGLEIGALLYEPREEPGPAIVKVHGGPTARSKRGFDRYTQFLVNQGYAVLDPNYRGSTGRGREFRNRIRNDWGGMEQVDVRRGAEWLAERDSVAPDRIAVFGVSYGGYSTYCQLTMHPEPWACGVAWVGMTDLLALYDESMAHFQSYLEDQLGDPATNEAFYRERSPIAHVANVDAPICMLHGTNDPRCPISQARRLRDALEERGLEAGEDGMFEYTELGAEGQGSTDVEQKVRAFSLLADFLNRRL
jgi:dipeptidyl aminopeptidase/acylaminoacyl peptidase